MKSASKIQLIILAIVFALCVGVPVFAHAEAPNLQARGHWKVVQSEKSALTSMSFSKTVDSVPAGNRIATAAVLLSGSQGPNYAGNALDASAARITSPAGAGYATYKAVASKMTWPDKYKERKDYTTESSALVTRIVRWSGVDPNFSAGPVTHQVAYMQENQAKWHLEGTFNRATGEGVALQPGDILVTSSSAKGEANGHICVYAGMNATAARWGSNPNVVVEAAYGMKMWPSSTPLSLVDGKYNVYRTIVAASQCSSTGDAAIEVSKKTSLWKKDLETWMKVPDETFSYVYDNYNIEYKDVIGGTANAPATKTFTYDTPTFKLASPVEAGGYEFNGWYDKPKGEGNKVTAIPKNSLDDVVVYAAYTGVPYTVKFDGNGGVSMKEMGPQTLTGGIATPLMKNIFVRTGYDFVGWNTSKDGKGRAYKDEQKVIDISPNTNTIILYAQWKIKTYTVNFNANGGQGTVDPVTANYGKTVKLPAVSFTMPGYSAVNWTYTAPNGKVSYFQGGSVVDPSDISSSETMELKAYYSPITYYVSFNANGGQGNMKKIKVLYDITYTLFKNEFTRTGYEFAGWSTDKDGEAMYADAAYVSNLCTVDNGTVELHAVWTKDASYDPFAGYKPQIQFDGRSQEFSPAIFDYSWVATNIGATFDVADVEGYYTQIDSEVTGESQDTVNGVLFVQQTEKKTLTVTAPTGEVKVYVFNLTIPTKSTPIAPISFTTDEGTGTENVRTSDGTEANNTSPADDELNALSEPAKQPETTGNDSAENKQEEASQTEQPSDNADTTGQSSEEQQENAGTDTQQTKTEVGTPDAVNEEEKAAATTDNAASDNAEQKTDANDNKAAENETASGDTAKNELESIFKDYNPATDPMNPNQGANQAPTGTTSESPMFVNETGDNANKEAAGEPSVGGPLFMDNNGNDNSQIQDGGNKTADVESVKLKMDSDKVERTSTQVNPIDNKAAENAENNENINEEPLFMDNNNQNDTENVAVPISTPGELAYKDQVSYIRPDSSAGNSTSQTGTKEITSVEINELTREYSLGTSEELFIDPISSRIMAGTSETDELRQYGVADELIISGKDPNADPLVATHDYLANPDSPGISAASSTDAEVDDDDDGYETSGSSSSSRSSESATPLVKTGDDLLSILLVLSLTAFAAAIATRLLRRR